MTLQTHTHTHQEKKGRIQTDGQTRQTNRYSAVRRRSTRDPGDKKSRSRATVRGKSYLGSTPRILFSAVLSISQADPLLFLVGIEFPYLVSLRFRILFRILHRLAGVRKSPFLALASRLSVTYHIHLRPRFPFVRWRPFPTDAALQKKVCNRVSLSSSRPPTCLGLPRAVSASSSSSSPPVKGYRSTISLRWASIERSTVQPPIFLLPPLRTEVMSRPL